jgi:hypothetical protein
MNIHALQPATGALTTSRRDDPGTAARLAAGPLARAPRPALAA